MRLRVLVLGILSLAPLSAGATPFYVDDAARDQAMVVRSTVTLPPAACDDPRADITAVRGAPGPSGFYDLQLAVRDVARSFGCATLPGEHVQTFYTLEVTPVTETPQYRAMLVRYLIGQSYQLSCVTYVTPQHISQNLCQTASLETDWTDSTWTRRVPLAVAVKSINQATFLFDATGVPSHVVASVESRSWFPDDPVGLPGVVRVDVTDAAPRSPVFTP